MNPNEKNDYNEVEDEILHPDEGSGEDGEEEEDE